MLMATPFLLQAVVAVSQAVVAVSRAAAAVRVVEEVAVRAVVAVSLEAEAVNGKVRFRNSNNSSAVRNIYAMVMPFIYNRSAANNLLDNSLINNSLNRSSINSASLAVSREAIHAVKHNNACPRLNSQTLLNALVAHGSLSMEVRAALVWLGGSVRQAAGHLLMSARPRHSSHASPRSQTLAWSYC